MTEFFSAEDASVLRVKVEHQDDSSAAGGQAHHHNVVGDQMILAEVNNTHNNHLLLHNSNNAYSSCCSTVFSGGALLAGEGNNGLQNNAIVVDGQDDDDDEAMVVAGAGNAMTVTTTTTTLPTLVTTANANNNWTWPGQSHNQSPSSTGASGIPPTTPTTLTSASASTEASVDTVSNSYNNGQCPFPKVEGLVGVGASKVIANNAILGRGQGGQVQDIYSMTSKEELLLLCQQLQSYIESMQRKHQDELSQVKESEEKIRIQQLESSRRENVLVMRLTTKEQEMQEYAAQLNELKASMVPMSGALRSTLLDPAVNFIIQKMKTELEETKKKLEDTQNDLSAWKFTPDSNTGKRLMAKCRMLYQENEELGKTVSSGRLAKLESDLALQKSLTVEMKKSQSELDELVQELDEDVEGMQGTILFLQQQLRKSNSSTTAAGAGNGNESTSNNTNTSDLTC